MRAWRNIVKAWQFLKPSNGYIVWLHNPDPLSDGAFPPLPIGQSEETGRVLGVHFTRSRVVYLRSIYSYSYVTLCRGNKNNKRNQIKVKQQPEFESISSRLQMRALAYCLKTHTKGNTYSISMYDHHYLGICGVIVILVLCT